MHDLLMPRLRHALSRPESAGDVGWFQLLGLFLQIYQSSEPGRETTGWIAVTARGPRDLSPRVRIHNPRDPRV